LIGFAPPDQDTGHSALTFELKADRIQAIYIVCNPDKLRHLTAGTGFQFPE
jgi:hypothetical protein